MFLCKPNNYLPNVATLSKSFIFVTHKKTQHECSSSLNLAIIFTLLQKKKEKQQTTTYLERTKEKYRRTNPYFKGAKIVKL